MNVTTFFLGIILSTALMANIGSATESATPSLSEVTAKLAAMNQTHPRLFGVADGFSAFKRNAQTPVGQAIAKRVIADAELVLQLPLLERRIDASGRRILEVSRAMLYRINTLAVAYQLTSQDKYADCAIKNMLNVCAYSDWNPRHFLDVGEMTLAVSIGYDWLYPKMTPEQRQTIADAIISKGLQAAALGNRNKNVTGWQGGGNNWTAVCYTGMIAGALATYETNPELSDNVIFAAITHLPKYFKESYGTKGAYPEGPMYWQYGTEFAVIGLDLLKSTLKDDFGLAERNEGFRQTGDFITHVYGPTGLMFSYADSTAPDHPIPDNTYFPTSVAKVWLSNHFQRPDWYFPIEQDKELVISNDTPFIVKTNPDPQRWSIRKWRERNFPLTLLFLPPQNVTATALPSPLSYFSGNEALFSVSMHRSDWTPQALYVGLKGGSPASGHGHMDEGSFVLDVNGVRWAEDLGQVDYAAYESRKLGIWDNAQKGFRWQIFRYGPDSHNILRIDNQPQMAKCTAPTTEFSSAPGQQLSTVDLSPVYEGQAKSITRTIRLLPNKQLMMTDHLTGLKPGAKIRWQMCTRAKIDKIDGLNVLLTRFDQQLTLTATASADGKWSAINCATLIRTFDPQSDKECSMLYFDLTAPADGNVKIVVCFRPDSTQKQLRQTAAPINSQTLNK